MVTEVPSIQRRCEEGERALEGCPSLSEPGASDDPPPAVPPGTLHGAGPCAARPVLEARGTRVPLTGRRRVSPVL